VPKLALVTVAACYTNSASRPEPARRAVILSCYDFSPFAVFLLFGLTGTLAETTFGPQHLLEFGPWIFVYRIDDSICRILCAHGSLSAAGALVALPFGRDCAFLFPAARSLALGRGPALSRPSQDSFSADSLMCDPPKAQNRCRLTGRPVRYLVS
jgi:hypothetical protein